MSLEVNLPEDLGARLAAAAIRRGITVDELLAVMVARLSSEPAQRTEPGDALEAFIGCGASGRTEPFEIRAARSEWASRRLAEGA